MKKETTIDKSELEKFLKMSHEWWDENGKFKPLHLLNPTRLKYIKDSIEAHFMTPKEELSILDIGCGGGLVAEPLSNIGFNVTGVDALEENIQIAQAHARSTGASVSYKCGTIESLAQDNQQYDVVLALEIIEHVSDVSLFIKSCAKCVKPGGLLFISTINKTIKSYLQAIIGAEYVLNWLPKGTHDWHKFLKPSSLIEHIGQNNLNLLHMKGIEYNFLTKTFNMTEKVDVNYFMLLSKLEN